MRATERKRLALAAIAAVLCVPALCAAQGTLTINFDGQPAGTGGTISAYSESGMLFWNPYGPENLARIGPGLNGYPDDATAYLAITLGAKLAFSFNTFPNTYFNLVSFDAANYGDNPPATLEVVGYKGMIGTVTNYFSTSFSFQTFYLDPQFQNVYRVDVLTDRWSLDNLVVSGVPEPTACALTAIGGLCWFAGRRMLGRRARLSPRGRA
jgi:hypothetical protein